MITAEIRHRTTDRDHEDVRLGPLRLMLRPRKSPDVRIEARHLDIRSAAELNASADVRGNTAVTATFAAATDMLTIVSVLRVASAARRADAILGRSTRTRRRARSAPSLILISPAP